MNELNITIPIRCVHSLKELKDGERGRLILAVVDYCTEGKEPTFIGLERVLWPEFKAAVDELREREKAIRFARAEGGKLGGRPKCQESCQELLNENLKVFCYESDPPSSPLETPINPPKEIISKDITKKSPRNRVFVPPVYEEVRLYCQQRNNNVDAQAFIDFYESKGWLVGKTKMKDWKAAVRTWERYSFGKEQPPTESPKKWDNTHRFVATGEFEGYWEDFIDGKWVRVD